MSDARPDKAPIDDLVFVARCPSLDLNVYLRRKTWVYKICNPTLAYRSMRGKEGLVESVITDPLSRPMHACSYPPNEIYFESLVPGIWPTNPYLRVGLIVKSNDVAIITTAFPVSRLKKGANPYVKNFN